MIMKCMVGVEVVGFGWSSMLIKLLEDYVNWIELNWIGYWSIVRIIVGIVDGLAGLNSRIVVVN